MLNIEKYVTMSPEQWEIVIEGMRNPKNSWGKIDSSKSDCSSYNCMTCPGRDDGELCEKLCTEQDFFLIGPNDHKLMMELKAGGPVHAKYLRMMPVWVTLTAPLYWWKEFDTYKVGTVANSCSTMHKIHAKEFTLEDFSHENLIHNAEDRLCETISSLNAYRQMYVNWDEESDVIRKAFDNDRRIAWYHMIQLLPSSYNQKRTVFLNYEVLSNIYKWRRNHKLQEWHVFCDWIETLPYPELITGEVKE